MNKDEPVTLLPSPARLDGPAMRAALARSRDACVLLDMPFTPDAAVWAEAARRYPPGSMRTRELLQRRHTWERVLASLSEEYGS